MNRILQFLPLAAMMVTAGVSQSLAEYQRMRKQFGIVRCAATASLDAFVRSKTVELRGLIQGVSRTDDGVMVTIMCGERGFDFEASQAPTWLFNIGLPARVIAKVDRSVPGSRLNVTFLGAAEVSAVTDAPSAPTKVVASRTNRAKPVVSRSKGRPPAMKGSIPTGSIPTGSIPTRRWELPQSDAMPIYAAYIKKQNKRLSDASAMKIAEGVIGFSLKYDVDARLIMAMVLVESGFDPNCVSHAGARGLGQLMPGTARGMGVGNSFDTTENLYGTVRLVRGHLDKYKKQTGGDLYRSLVLALAAYNAGGGAVKRYGGVPPYRETQNYVKKVIAAYKRLSGEA